MDLNMPGGTVHYEDEGKGPVLVCIHGDPGRPKDFRWMVPFLTPFFRVLRIASPGMDLTDLAVNPEPDTESRTNFIRDCLDELHIEKAIIMGHSMGASIALDYGVRWPEKTLGVVLLNPVCLSPHRPFKQLRNNLFIPLLKTPLKPLFSPLMRRAFIRSGFPKGVSTAAFLQVIRCGLAFDFQRHRDNATRLKSPCLRVHSKDDPLIDLKRFLKLNEVLRPDRHVIFEDGGHNIQKKHPEQLSNIIQEWACDQGWLNE